MKASTTNKARGTGNVVAGKTKQTAGKIIGNRKVQVKGIAQEVGGRIQKAVGKDQESRGR